MKKVKIYIRELGAVRDSEVEVKPLMIFSGESGLGKSYVAILVHYLYKLLTESRLQRFFDSKGWSYDTLASTSPDTGAFSVSVDELLLWINNDASQYMRDAVGNPELHVDISFEVPISQVSYKFTYRTVLYGVEGKEMRSVVFELDNTYNIRIDETAKSMGSLPWSLLLQSSLSRAIFDSEDIEQTFCMVPGRGALLNLSLTAQDRLKASKDIYSEFLSDWGVVRGMQPFGERDEELVSRLYDINGGKIEIDDDDKVIYRLASGEPFPINAAASSIKELAPLYMLLDKYPANRLSILFEEPEAHLHPQKQVDIADFVVRAVNKGSHIQITTHSDYFVRRLNDRIFLHMIRDLDSVEYGLTLERYGYSDLSVDASLIGAYLLRRETDGSVKVFPQQLDKGIPYESFYDVIEKEARHSLDIQQSYYKLKSRHAE